MDLPSQACPDADRVGLRRDPKCREKAVRRAVCHDILLVLNGYSTAQFGKCHEVPPRARSARNSTMSSTWRPPPLRSPDAPRRDGTAVDPDAQRPDVIDVVSDALTILLYLFLGGDPPPSPGPPPMACGRDLDAQGSPGDLGCGTYGGC